MRGKTASSRAGAKTTGYTGINDKDGNLLVAFNSEDESFCGYHYDRQRIKYCMRHRRNTIPEYLRTGDRPKSIKKETIRLWFLNLLRR